MLRPWANRPRSTQWLLAGIAAVLAALAIAWLLLVPATNWLAHQDVGSARGQLLQTARDAAQGRLLTLGAGLVAVAALVFTARNLALYRRTVELTQRTFELTEQGQVTDRYTKAIEQLGSDKLDVRIGGIYALERVARDSARDQPTVMEVLAAFIREHSRERWLPIGDDQSGADDSERVTRPDVQAAVTVIGRRDPRHDRQPVDLALAVLVGVNLVGADLTGAKLIRVDLAGADLTGAKLIRVDLAGADLTGANLAQTNLTGANLLGANLAGANLAEANLSGANLFHARLTGANLIHANLTGAILTHARLIAANLFRADLTKAILVDAKLNGANLTAATLTDGILNIANLTDATLDAANLNGATLESANLDGATFDSANLTSATLTGANLVAADLTKAYLADALLSTDAVVPNGWQRDVGSGRLIRVNTSSD